MADVDTHGNVYEWCDDWYGDYGEESQVNPTGPVEGLFRVWRELAQQRAERAFGGPRQRDGRRPGLRVPVCPSSRSKQELQAGIASEQAECGSKAGRDD